MHFEDVNNLSLLQITLLINSDNSVAKITFNSSAHNSTFVTSTLVRAPFSRAAFDAAAEQVWRGERHELHVQHVVFVCARLGHAHHHRRRVRGQRRQRHHEPAWLACLLCMPASRLAAKNLVCDSSAVDASVIAGAIIAAGGGIGVAALITSIVVQRRKKKASSNKIV